MRRALLAIVAALVLAGSFAAVRWWDFALPTVGHQRYQAVFLVNGQTFFGRYNDRIGPYVKIVAPYYVQQSTDPNDPNKVVESRIVRRGNELHGPLDEMLVPRVNVLFVEDLSEGSPIAQFMAKTSP
jgi:hypothetical protein